MRVRPYIAYPLGTDSFAMLRCSSQFQGSSMKALSGPVSLRRVPASCDQRTQ
jgi:hypothetical protein